MTEITINTINDKSLTFVGELIRQSECGIEFADSFERSIKLKLYATESGGFVPTIEYLSDNQAENSGSIAEQLDQAKDIENFYFVFVPEELLPEADRLNRDEIDVRRRLLTVLRKSYEGLTFAFLDESAEASDTNANSISPESKTDSTKAS